jgi:putative NADH-flavin reductase
MKLVVLGASGGVGKHVVEQAARSGHEVTAVARAPVVVPAGVRMVRVEVLAPGSLDVVQGHDVVLSCLGIRRAHPKNPWSKLTSPPDFCSHSARLLVDAMQRHGVKKVVAVSAAGVAESAGQMNALMRFFVATSSIGLAYRDLAVMERVYADSGLDWLCPRPVTLTDGPMRSSVVEVDRFGVTHTISRASVAGWMLAHGAPGAAVPSTRTPQIAEG